MVVNEGRGAPPQLEGQALSAVRHRGGHLQIIAGAGSGKTEVVSQRVADLLADGFPPEAIVAFTFTERAAEELKDRIGRRAEDRLGPGSLDRLAGLFVGTIHAYCFRLLQQRAPRYETYDVLDDNQLTAFLSREEKHLGLRQFDPDRPDPNKRIFAGIRAFLKGVGVVENELLYPATLEEPFKTVIRNYYESLDHYRLLTYGLQIVRAVRELERPDLAAEVHSKLQHLIVDEYQDVNPAQERLIRLLTGPKVELCVVGDDQQAIYQWRGSKVANIMTFSKRYEPVATFEIVTNRRSRPQLIEVANDFATTIPERLQKTMAPHREPGAPPLPEVVAWSAPNEAEEVGWVANLILDLVDTGARYRDIAVLVRTRAAYPRLRETFASFDIPVQPGGRTGLFDQPEAVLLGKTICWLVNLEWRGTYGSGEQVTHEALLARYQELFKLDDAARNRLAKLLLSWKEAAASTARPADLVGELYELLGALNVGAWDLKEPVFLNKLGTLARFSALLADYESVRRRARPDAENAGEQVGGQDRGRWYYQNLATYIVNYAQGAYEGFDGEEGYDLDAVDLTTVHQAKGLEWPAVFVPSVTANRFPTSRTGHAEHWVLPRNRFDAARYEGSDADERRLFYVAITRARDWLSVSRHERVEKNKVGQSPYHRRLEDMSLVLAPEDIRVPALEARDAADQPVSLTYSELADFLECGLAFRLRNLVGFKPRLAKELGYGKAVHHVMRAVAEATKASGRVPSPADIDEILDRSFFLPHASKPEHRQMKDAARRLVTTYTQKYEDDLYRVWEVERPFELHLDGVTVAGRADVILDREGGAPTALAIVDYKLATHRATHGYDLQLQVYTDAGRREGLDVRGAYVHDLKAASRNPVPVGPEAIGRAETGVARAAARIRKRDYQPSPGLRCRSCEVRTICAHAKP